MLAERPKCWGRQYDSEDRTCKGCSWQVTCKEQVIRGALERQPQSPPTMSQPTYYQPYPPPTQYTVPQQVPVAGPQPSYYQQPATRPTTVATVAPPPPAQQPQYQMVQFRAPAPPAQAPQQQMQPPAQPMMPVAQQPQPYYADRYGQYQDPMVMYLHAAPPPYRPQFEGESFWERMGKNIALSMAEAAIGGLLLGVRQLMLPPGPPTIDVDPNQHR